MVDIWSDPEFIALPAGAQRLYMFLISQPDIAHDGVLALRERRWAGLASNLTAESVVDDLRVLATARFVVIDQTTEELLVRSFIRRDGVYRQPNLLLAAKKHLALVTSMPIRLAIARELRRILTLPDVPKRCADNIGDMLAELPDEPDPEGSPNPTGKGSPNPSDMTRDMPTPISREGIGVVTAVTKQGPYPLSPEPLPPPAGNSLTLVPRTDPPESTQDLVGEWIDHCRKRPPSPVIGQVSKQVKALLAEGIDPSDVRAGLAAWHRKGVHPSVLPSMVNELMNASPTQARASPNGLIERNGLKLRPDTAAHLDDRARWAAIDAANQQPAIEGPDP